MRFLLIGPILGIFGLLKPHDEISEALNANRNLEETIQNSCWPLRRKDFKQSKLARNGNIQTIQLDINGVNFENEYLILLTDANEEFTITTNNGAIVDASEDDQKAYFFSPETFESQGQYKFDLDFGSEKPKCVRFKTAFTCSRGNDGPQMKFAGAFRADFAASQSPMVKLTKSGDNCISIPAGSSISNSFSCRNCFRIITDFQFSVAEFFSLGGQENMVLDIQFASDVSSHNVWYPVDSVKNLASNKLRFGFAAQHNWSQGHIQWEAQLKNDGGHVSNSVTSVTACPLIPVTSMAPATTPAPGTGSTDVTTGSSMDFMCKDILQMVEIKDQWNCRSCSRARIYGSVQGITSDHIMTMTFNKEIDFNQIHYPLKEIEMVGSRLDEYVYKFIFDPQAHFHNELNVEVTFKYDGNEMPAVTNAQLCTVAQETTASVTTATGATTALTVPAITTPVPDHCEDILSLVEIKDKWQCRACSRARFYAPNVPRLSNDDTLTVTFDAEVEFRNINHPIKDILNVGEFKYQITFQDNAHLHNQLNVEVEFKYSGDNAPELLQAQLCDSTPATTDTPTIGPATLPGETTPVATTVVTTPVPDHCQDILSVVEIKDHWQCRACSRARFFAQNIPTFTPDDTLTITFDEEVEFRNINYPIKAITNIGQYKYEISFESGAHLNNQLNIEVEFKYSGNTAPSVTQAQLCDPAPGVPTTHGPTTPVPDHCEDILSIVQIKDNWQCRACSRARIFAQNMPRLSPDDTLTITFDAEVEFRNINYPIKDITNIGGFKYEISFQLGAHLNNQLNVEAEFSYFGNIAPLVIQAQLCDPTPLTTEAVTTVVGATPTAPTTPALTTPIPDHCEDILSIVEIKDHWQCRACSRARIYAQIFPQLTPDDTITVTFDDEVEFRNINYPIKEITNLGEFKYQISFEPGAHLNSQLNVEVEFKYDGISAPAVVQAWFCDSILATTDGLTTDALTTPAVTSPGESTPAPTTPAVTPPAVTSSLPDGCSNILSLIELKDKWQCRACSRARVYSTLQQITVNDIMTITMDREIELINQRYPIKSFTSLGGFKYEITFDPAAHFLDGVNIEFEFKYVGQLMPSVTQATLCGPSSDVTTQAVTTPAITSPAVTTLAETTATLVTTPVPDNCENILNLVEMKDTWNCRACSRARIYGNINQGIYNDDKMTIIMDSEIKFLQVRYPIASINSVGALGEFKYEFTFNPAIDLSTGLPTEINIEFEFEYDGNQVPNVLSALMCGEGEPDENSVSTTAPITSVVTHPSVSCEELVPFFDPKDMWPCDGFTCVRFRVYGSVENSFAGEDAVILMFNKEILELIPIYPLNKAEHMGLNIWAFNFQQEFGKEINFEAIVKIEGTEKPQLYAGGACSIVDQSSFASTYGLDDFFGSELVTTQAPETDVPADGLNTEVCEGVVDYKMRNGKASITRSGENSKVVRLQQPKVKETKKHTGFVVFTKAACGKDFLSALQDGRVLIDFDDKKATYSVPYAPYYADNGSSTQVVIQYQSDPSSETNKCPQCLGTTTADELDMLVVGINTVAFGNKKISTCLNSVQVGHAGVAGSPSLLTEDQSGCVAWTNIIF